MLLQKTPTRNLPLPFYPEDPFFFDLKGAENTRYGNSLLLTNFNHVIIRLLGVNSEWYIYCLKIFFSAMRRDHICSQPCSAVVLLRHFNMDSQHPGCWTGSVLACNPAVRHRPLSHFHTLTESARNNCCPLYVHFLNVVFQNKNNMLQS